MKTKHLLLSLSALILGSFAAQAVVPIGSAYGSDLMLYDQHNTESVDPLTVKRNGDDFITLSYKIVSKGNKVWACTNLANAQIGGASWASQLRYWSATNQKTENNLVGRVTGTAVTYGSSANSYPDPDSFLMTFFQAAEPGGFAETECFAYTMGVNNNANPAEVLAPQITECVVQNIEETSANLAISVSKGDCAEYYYEVTDAEHGIDEIFFFDNVVLNDLISSTEYNLTITPRDFSGNVGTPYEVSFTTGGFIQISYGVANDVRFVLKSTESTLEVYMEPTDPNKTFIGAAAYLTPAGSGSFEPAGKISPDGKYFYVKTSDNSLNGKIITIDCRYNIDGEWVMSNNVITEGEMSGKPIKHLMGGAVAPETELPVLNGVEFIGRSDNSIILDLDGQDNTIVYYEITGGEEPVNAFRTGQYYFTSFKPGNVYNLTITAMDLAGNRSSNSIQVPFKAASRSNVFDGDNFNYNTTLKPEIPGGELAAIIQYNGETLTLGCTTISDKLPTGNQNRTFWSEQKSAFLPTVKIDGVSYSLESNVYNEDPELANSAIVSFTDFIGEKPLTEGAIITVQWNVFWSSNSGNFFTGVFDYKIGDYGQADIVAPTLPNLQNTGTSVTWPPCFDALSEVEKYVVNIDGDDVATILDLNEESYEYTLPETFTTMSVKAYDFAGNYSESQLPTSVCETANLNMLIISSNNGFNVVGVEVKALDLCDLTGKTIASSDNAIIQCNKAGVYLLKVTTADGNVVIEKVLKAK